MIGGLRTTSRYLLAGASVIGLLAIGTPEAKAQNMQEIQAQIDQMQATIKALAKAGAGRQGASLRGERHRG